MRAVLILFLLLAVVPAFAGGVRDFHLDLEGGHLKVSFWVEGALPEGVEDSLRAGVPLFYDFTLKVYRKRSWWLDKKVIAVRFRHRLQYDNLQALFYLQREEDGKVLTFKSLAEAMTSMAKVTLDLGRLDRLPEGRYRLKLKTKIGLRKPRLWPLALLRPLLGVRKNTASYLCEFTLTRPLFGGVPSRGTVSP